MTTIRPWLGCLVLAVPLCVLSGSGSQAQTPRKAELRQVDYAELGRIVRSLEGKVVVVYFWADY